MTSKYRMAYVLYFLYFPSAANSFGFSDEGRVKGIYYLNSRESGSGGRKLLTRSVLCCPNRPDFGLSDCWVERKFPFFLFLKDLVK